VPNGSANVGGLNNSGNDPSGAGNAAKVPTAPGTNAAGTANSSGASAASGPSGSGSGGGTVGSNGMANSRAGAGANGRIDGVTNPGPDMPGDAAIKSEDAKVDAKVKSICRGC
jgi:hypothetical protein